MSRPLITNPTANQGIVTRIVPHVSWKDAIEITIPQGTISGYNKIERLSGSKKVDYTEFYANETGDTIVRWHLPPKLFKDNKSYKLKITQLPYPPVTTPSDPI
jgi:hypothetical protein